MYLFICAAIEAQRTDPRVDGLEMQFRSLALNIYKQPAPVTTEAEFTRNLRDNNTLFHSPQFDNDLKAILSRTGWVESGSISDIESKLEAFLAPPNRQEKDRVYNNMLIEGTQTLFNKLLNRLFSSNDYFALNSKKNSFMKTGKQSLTNKSRSVMLDCHDRVTYRNRKPDIVAYVKPLSGSLAIYMIGDLKPSEDTDDYDFNEAQIGHVLDMVKELLQNVQPWRLSFISFLTDTRRFQFFRTFKTSSNSYSHHQSSIFKKLDGFRLLLSLILADPSEYGYEDCTIPQIEYSTLLGSSNKKYVFAGVYQQKNVIIKIFENEHSKSREATILQRLQQLSQAKSDLVPVLVDDSIRTINNKYAIIMSPRCLPVQPCYSHEGVIGEIVYGQDIADLVLLLEVIHTELGIIHRDIKPSNIFKINGHIFLNDWGSAVFQSDDLIPYEGTFGFSSQPLSKLHIPKPEDDLLSLAKSAYIMLFNQNLPDPNSIINIEQYWNIRFHSNCLWKEIERNSKEKQYARLALLYKQIK